MTANSRRLQPITGYLRTILFGSIETHESTAATGFYIPSRTPPLAGAGVRAECGAAGFYFDTDTLDSSNGEIE